MPLLSLRGCKMYKLLLFTIMLSGGLASSAYGLDKVSDMFCAYQDTYNQGMEMAGESIPELQECLIDGEDGILKN